MSWQKCPVCDGNGQILADGFISSVYQQCPVCRGYRIIDEVNGLPPQYEFEKRIEDAKEWEKLQDKIFNEPI